MPWKATNMSATTLTTAQYDSIDPASFESCDHYARQIEWNAQHSALVNTPAGLDATIIAADTVRVQMVLDSRTPITDTQRRYANEALAEVEPGLSLGTVSIRTAARLLGSYFTPAEVLDTLGR